MEELGLNQLLYITLYIWHNNHYRFPETIQTKFILINLKLINFIDELTLSSDLILFVGIFEIIRLATLQRRR